MVAEYCRGMKTLRIGWCVCVCVWGGGGGGGCNDNMLTRKVSLREGNIKKGGKVNKYKHLRNE